MRMQRRQEATSINLANATSTGYRAVKPKSDGFATVLQEQMDGVEPPVARGIFGFNGIGQDGSGVEPERFAIDTSQGALRQTDNSLDLAIQADLRRGGFEGLAVFETVDLPTMAASPRVPAVAICQGTPMRHEIEARDPADVLRATDTATAAVAARFGDGAVVADSRAFLVVVETV